MTDQMIISSNLSEAWARALLLVRSHEVAPLTVSIDVSKGLIESHDVRQELDNALSRVDEFSVDTVAGTIFPTSMWNRNLDRQVLYRRYRDAFPKIRKFRQNCYGTYFQRLTLFNVANKKRAGEPLNQLEQIISTYKGGNHRRTALQATVFDPEYDMTNQRRRGFPCLQQVAFATMGDGLVVSGFYAMQDIFQKGYGNYLGLFHLGTFMAHELELPLVRVNCFAGVARSGAKHVADLDGILRLIEGNNLVFTK